MSNWQKGIENYYTAEEAARSLEDYEAQTAAENMARDLERTENLRQMAEDSRLARDNAKASDRKSNLAIIIAIVSMALTILAIVMAHLDSNATTKAIVEAIRIESMKVK